MLSTADMSLMVVVAVQALHQELKCSSRASGYFTLFGAKAPPSACDSSKVARKVNVVVLTAEAADTVGV